MSGRLTEGFRDIIELRWDEFVALEESADATNFDAIVSAIARAASKSNLRAIQTALDRLDGKIAMEVKVEYPKFYTLYPQATKTADDPGIIDVSNENHNKELSYSKIEPENRITDAPVEEELPTGSLRAVLEKMLNSPKTVVDEILYAASQVDKGETQYGNPLVKSVIVAGLMKMVHNGRISAVFEVFDQIDGKVADTFKMLGDDVYMYSYSKIAPAGAVKNEQGIYQVQADNTTNSWLARLEERNARTKSR